MFTDQAASGGPIGDPFDFHGELHLAFFPKSGACEASQASLLFFSLPAHLRLLGFDTMRGNRVMMMQNTTTRRTEPAQVL
jgi:hypothetical protein